MIALLFVGIGIALLSWGGYALRGPVNVWIIDTHHYGYGAIPLGLASLIWGFAFAAIPSEEWRLLTFFIGAVVLMTGLSIPQKWLDPPWMRELKRKHARIMLILQKEIDKMGLREWNRQINTEAELEEWVAEVRRRHGFPER